TDGFQNHETPAISASSPPSDAVVPNTSVPEGADFFDPGMMSKSTVHQEQRGAHIRDVRIVTLSGEPVNVLNTGRRYAVEYWTDFQADARDVGFGIGITSVAGVHLAGAQCRASRIR
ncbi:MAG: hypothetical protein E5V79_06790, partial [Mesorhizobium sp.]